MESILIRDRDLNSEYFIDDLPVSFLDNVKDINLFIGANNTRKSRFLRRIIQLEKKIIIDTKTSLNAAFTDSYKLIAELKKFTSNDIIISFQNSPNHTPEVNKRFYHLQKYYQNNNAPRQNVTYTLIAEHIKKINETLVEIIDAEVVKFTGEVEAVYDFLDFLVYIIEKEKAGHQYGVRYSESNANIVRFSISDQAYKRQLPEAQEKIALIIQVKEYFEILKGLQPKVLNKGCVYIPVLRSSRNLINSSGKVEGSQIFETTILQQYFRTDKLQKVIIHTGQNNYTKIASAKNGKTDQRNNFAEFEKFIGVSFFQSADIVVTAYSEGSHPEITISLPGEMEDVPIHDLGDGVQGILNLFFPIFTAEEGAWIFIDEPELNLHPGFQNLFVRTLLENEFLAKKKLRYFLNSHSNHILSELLLGGTKKSEIFVFHKRNQMSSNIKAFQGFETSTLELLGVLNTSNLISNCSVWVEGITDRIYLRAFLTAFLKNKSGLHPIEGLNYTFIEYGGKNLVHYMFEED